MDPTRRLLMLLCAAWPVPGIAADAARSWMLPPIDGDLSGEFAPLFLPGAPPLQWQLKIRSDQPRARTLTGAIDGPGLKVRGGAVLDPGGEGTWTLAEAAIDLGEWCGWAVARFLPESPATSLGGVLTVRGAGSWRRGVLDGVAEVGWRDGRLEDPGRKLVVEGLALQVNFEALGARRTAARQSLKWRGGRYDTIPFGPGTVVFSLDGDSLRVDSASLAIFGGELQVGALVLAIGKPDLAVTAQMRGVDIQQILFLLPPVLAAAQGRLDGQLALHRDESGIRVGGGRLSLRQGETADLRFTPTPGLLSSHLPAAVREHYPGLGQMETGGIPLRANLLEVTLTPAGDAEGRTAAVRIEGGPADATLKAPVVLQLNVRGSLDSVVKFGTHERLRLGSGP